MVTENAAFLKKAAPKKLFLFFIRTIPEIFADSPQRGISNHPLQFLTVAFFRNAISVAMFLETEVRQSL